MRFHLLATAALLSSGLVAHADTTFYLNGTLTNGGTFTGSLNWSPNGGVLNLPTFTHLDLTTSTGYSYVGAVLTVPESGEKVATEMFPDILLTSDASGLHDSVLDKSFTGTFLCGTAELCGDELAFPDAPASSVGGLSVATGTISLQQSVSTPMSAAPEPPGFALFGTGILGAAGVMRRRLAS